MPIQAIFRFLMNITTLLSFIFRCLLRRKRMMGNAATSPSLSEYIEEMKTKEMDTGNGKTLKRETENKTTFPIPHT